MPPLVNELATDNDNQVLPGPGPGNPDTLDAEKAEIKKEINANEAKQAKIKSEIASVPDCWLTDCEGRAMPPLVNELATDNDNQYHPNPGPSPRDSPPPPGTTNQLQIKKKLPQKKVGGGLGKILAMLPLLLKGIGGN